MSGFAPPKITTADAQAAIFDALEDRGYTAGLTFEQLTARQVCKMLEEVLEAAQHVEGFSGTTDMLMDALRHQVRAEFDDLARWQNFGRVRAFSKLKTELADVAVTLANASEAIAWSDEAPFVAMDAAVEKATADITRGIR